ncbi:hypothetical protein TNCV_2033911 [Trichonephila clavipes]|nr:hypothetical protein TNCV_2033911 [Trichonephila clavipes]
MDDLRVVYVKVKGEQEMANAVMDTGAQMPVVRPDVVEGQSIDNRGSIQITSAFGEHEMVKKHANDSQSCETSRTFKERRIISSTDSKSVCSQEVVTDLLPETQSLLNVPNGDLVAVKINGSNVQTNGQVSFQLHRPGMTDELFVGWEGPLTPAKGEWVVSPPPWNVDGKWQGFGLWVRRSEVMSECC